MPYFAEIALVVTLCAPGAQVSQEAAQGVTQTTGSGCIDSVSRPSTWASANVVEARQDWDECKAQERAYMLRPGESVQCQYTALAGVARKD